MREPELARRAGYSVLELLIVLAIMALAAAVVLPQGVLMLDRLALHAVQFEFQRDISELRTAAYASEAPIELRSAGEKAPGSRVLTLRANWTYRLDQPIHISAGGVCSGARVEILKLGRPMMHLKSADSACHFIRLD